MPVKAETMSWRQLSPQGWSGSEFGRGQQMACCELKPQHKAVTRQHVRSATGPQIKFSNGIAVAWKS